MARDVFVKNIRRISTKKSVCIVNTDISSLPGQHWIAVYFSGKGQCEYFDSYGLPPIHTDIRNALRQCNLKLFYNPCTFQGVTTNVCGEYCLLFLFLRCRGFSMKTIQSFSHMLESMTTNWSIWTMILEGTTRRNTLWSFSGYGTLHAYHAGNSWHTERAGISTARAWFMIRLRPTASELSTCCIIYLFYHFSR